MNPKLIVTGNTHPADTAASKSESFYKLTGSDAKHLYDLGVFSAQAYVLMIIRSHGAVGWKWTFKVKDFCKEWCIGERNFYRAISKLKALDLIHWEAKDTITVWYGSDIAQDASNNTTSVQKASILVSKQKPVENLETRSSCKFQATVSTNTLTNVSLTDKSVSPTDKNVSPLTKVSVPLTKVSQEIAETLTSFTAAEASDLIQIPLDPTDNVLAEKKLFDEEKEKEASQEVDDFTTSESGEIPCLEEEREATQEVEPTGILEEQRPDPITQVQQATVQLLDERQIFDDLRRLGVETNETVRAVMKKFKANVPDAIAHIKQRYNNRHERFKNITGAFVKACQEGAKPQMTTRSQVKPPTIEQMCQLEQAKVSRSIRDFYLAPCGSDREMIMVDTGTGMMPWWEYLIN